MNKYSVSLALLASATTAFASSDLTANFEITGGISYGKSYYDELLLNMDFGTKYHATEGVLSNDRSSVSTIGTCFFTLDEGTFCKLQGSPNRITVNIEKDLSGTIILQDKNGYIVSTAPIRFIGAK